MKKTVLALAVLITTSTLAQAQTATFTDINDLAPGRFFSPALSVANGNVLTVGLDAGRDNALWKDRAFMASGYAYGYQEAADVLTFTAQAPTGFYVSRVTYVETLAKEAARTGRPYNVTLLVVAGVAQPGLTADLGGQRLTKVPVAVTTSLVSSSARVQVVSARVFVEILPLP